MSHVVLKAAVAGLLLAVSASAAHAAKPITPGKSQSVKKPMTIEQKIALGQAMARSHAPRKAPKTMAQAAKTEVPLAAGGAGAEVSDDLHNYLSAVRDSQGRLHLIETEGAPRPGKLAAEVSNEK